MLLPCHLTEARIVPGAHEHAPDDVRARDALRALDHFEPVQLLCIPIRVCAVRQQAGVVAMHHVVNLVLCEKHMQKLWAQLIGRICNSNTILERQAVRQDGSSLC